ncbi:MAG: ATP-binding protein [Bacteroidales bacterium]|nr:ATP-binding protein [Bacteroidales bacterium]MCF8389409.1 ATP-binding protein [Bacteroidales bacterium]
MLQEGKVMVLLGARQVGKTSLIKKMISERENVFKGDGNDFDLQELLNSLRLSLIKSALDNYSLIFIDEAQKIRNIGEAIKLIVDHLPGSMVILSGSSSFDLSNKIGEPLTGRQTVNTLYPLSILELENQYGRLEILNRLDTMLIYGNYPEVVTAENNKKRIDYLINLRNSFLLKDILELDNIRNPSKLFDLLRLLAYQIGNEVSLNELSKQLGIAKQTVERYLDLLEKVFIIKKSQGFSRNLRKEITKTHRYYFWDNGVRNSIINNFNPLNMRNDKGLLWENFLFSERLKTRHYKKIYANEFFWRTYDQKEIDLIEERDGNIFAYEFKWSSGKQKAPKLWLTTYPDSEFKLIDKDNFLEFLC